MISQFQKIFLQLLLVLFGLLFNINSYSKPPLPLTFSLYPQRTIYYDEYLDRALDYIPEKSWGFASMASLSPRLGKVAYLNMCSMISFQKQNGFSEYMSTAFNREFVYLKQSFLLSIRTPKWNETKISANFEAGPQFSYLWSYTMIEVPYNGYQNRSMFPEFKDYTIDFVWQASLSFKLSSDLFFMTGVRYDKTRTSPNESLTPDWYSSLDGQEMEYYHKNIGIIIGITLALGD